MFYWSIGVLIYISKYTPKTSAAYKIKLLATIVHNLQSLTIVISNSILDDAAP